MYAHVLPIFVIYIDFIDDKELESQEVAEKLF
jgi:hypothetical protein